ncbi:MAG: diguanylate cyclase [Anaerolineae bacterium]
MRMRYQGRNEPVRKILVVDDEEAVCGFLKRVLDGRGNHVEVSHGGPDAIDKLERESFDLVITDLKMAGVDGVGVLRKAKELDPLCEVIVITGYASVNSAVEVMKLGAYDYISKPFNLERIRFLVDRALEKRRLLQAAADRDSYKRLSQLDGMTEVHNRRGFYQLLSAEISRCRRFGRQASLLMIDLDDLKAINDSHGHQAGDTVLVEVASTLKRSVRNCDIVARYGGDEFAVILVETSKMDAITTADRLRGLMSMSGHLSAGLYVGPKHATTISIGVSSYPTDAGDTDELVSKADRALYAAKASGGNCVQAARP